MNYLIEKHKIMLNNNFNNIEEAYSYIKYFEKIDFNNYSEYDLITFLNNSNCKFIDSSTGKLVYKLPKENFTKEVLIRMCESHNQKLIEKYIINLLKVIGKLINESYISNIQNKILEDTSKSNNDKIRLQCALSSPNYISFLNDRNQDIKKIAHEKLNYNYEIENYSQEEKKFIKFLEEMINANLIKFDYCPVTVNYDSKKRLITSEIFNEDETEIDYILTEISNKKIVANIIYNLLLESQLTFNEKFEPSYWKDILKMNGLQKVIGYRKIHK